MEEKIIKNRKSEIKQFRNEDTVKYSVPRLETKFTKVEGFSILNLYEDVNIKSTFSEHEDFFEVEMKIDETLISYRDLAIESEFDIYRLGINLCNLRVLLSRHITPFIHPDNLLFDVNLMPKVMYRGYHNMLEPMEYSEQDLLIEIKCFLISILDTKYSYEDLVRSNLKVSSYSGVLKEIVACDSIDSLSELLNKKIIDGKKHIHESMKLVEVKKIKNRRLYSIAMSTTTALFAIVIAYTFLVTVPYKNAQLNATTYYLSQDYSQVIKILSGYSTNKLSSSAKYELAHASIEMSSLNSEQKKNVLSKLSVNSYELYLDYWIHYGRGEYETAHTEAEAMQDVELKYFAVISYLDYLANDNKMDSATKQAKISEYQGYKDSYEKELESIKKEVETSTNKEPATNQNEGKGSSGNE